MKKKTLFGLVSTLIVWVFIHFLKASLSNSHPQPTTTNQTTQVVINNAPLNNSAPTPAPLSSPPIKLPSNKQLESASHQMKLQKLRTPIKVILNCKTDQKVRIQKNFYVWCNGFSNFKKRWMREIRTNFLSRNLIFDQDDYNNHQLVYVRDRPYRLSVLKTKNPTEVILKIEQAKL